MIDTHLEQDLDEYSRPDRETKATTRVLELKVRDEKEIPELAARFFKQDLAYFLKEMQARPEVTRLSFRALGLQNPNGLPILITRPDIPFPDRDYINGDEIHPGYEDHEARSSIFHEDIYKGYSIEAKTRPNSERARITHHIEAAGGYHKLGHLYLELQKGSDGKIDVFLESGWSYLTDSSENQSGNQRELLKQMLSYGITKIDVGSWQQDQVNVEKMVLEDMLRDTITANAEILGTMVTPTALDQYKDLLLSISPTHWPIANQPDTASTKNTTN